MKTLKRSSNLLAITPYYFCNDVIAGLEMRTTLTIYTPDFNGQVNVWIIISVDF